MNKRGDRVAVVELKVKLPKKILDDALQLFSLVGVFIRIERQGDRPYWVFISLSQGVWEISFLRKTDIILRKIAFDNYEV